jgi:hypothetical protein
MTIYVTVYVGSDTTTKIKVLDKEVPVDLSDVLRITLECDGEFVDSDVDDDAFEWLGTPEDPFEVGEIWLKLGAYLTQRNCDPIPARLTIYDILTPNGVVLGEGCNSPLLMISVC